MDQHSQELSSKMAQIIGGSSFRVTGGLRYGAHTLAYAAVNKRHYIAYAGVIFAPRIAVYQVKTVN